MKVRFKKLRDNAKLPTKAHDDDFCYDVYACDRTEVAPNVYKYPLGFAVQIDPDENFGLKEWNEELLDKLDLSIDFRPRSSVWKTGMVLCNSCGTVDRGYTGEVSAYFYHIMPNMPRYQPGERVAQMKIGFTLPIQFEVVDELEETERGDGGFGSTGQK